MRNFELYTNPSPTVYTGGLPIPEQAPDYALALVDPEIAISAMLLGARGMCARPDCLNSERISRETLHMITNDLVGSRQLSRHHAPLLLPFVLDRDNIHVQDQLGASAYLSAEDLTNRYASGYIGLSDYKREMEEIHTADSKSNFANASAVDSEGYLYYYDDKSPDLMSASGQPVKTADDIEDWVDVERETSAELINEGVNALRFSIVGFKNFQETELHRTETETVLGVLNTDGNFTAIAKQSDLN